MEGRSGWVWAVVAQSGGWVRLSSESARHSYSFWPVHHSQKRPDALACGRVAKTPPLELRVSLGAGGRAREGAQRDRSGEGRWRVHACLTDLHRPTTKPIAGGFVLAGPVATGALLYMIAPLGGEGERREGV